MKRTRTLNTLLAVITTLGMLLTSVQPGVAQNTPAPVVIDNREEGEIRYGTSAQTGKMNFVGAIPGEPIEVKGAQAYGLSPYQMGLALIEPYAAAFGLKDPASELQLMSDKKVEERSVIRYQQVYQGIPVMAGELVVNADGRNRLLSLNGEVSPDLALLTHPALSADQARQTALEAVAGWYNTDASSFTVSEPALWIYDSRLIGPDKFPAVLTWRMDVNGVDAGLPVNELVLVDAQTGGIALHFNQVEGAVAMEGYARVELKKVATTWYVSNANGDNSNDCLTPATPCATIYAGMAKAADGDTINIDSGFFSTILNPRVYINKNLTLNGGWDSTFSAQSSWTTVDGSGSYGVGIVNVVEVAAGNTATLNRFILQGGHPGVYIPSGASLTINNSIIKNNLNQFTEGGGFFNEGNLTINNSTVSSNQGVIVGGIYNKGGTIQVRNSTIVNNQSTSYGDEFKSTGGVYNQSGSITLRNSILANNTGLDNADCEGNIASGGHNLVGSTSGCNFSTGTGDLVNVDPKLSVLIGVGYHALHSDSPAINAGDAAICPVTDIRGNARAGTCDIGSYEYTTPGAAGEIYLNSDQYQRAWPSTAFPQALQVLVLDSAGSPVAGVEVTFTAPSSGPTGSFANGTAETTGTSNVDGIATSSTFTANSEKGEFTIQATASGIATILEYTLRTNNYWYVSMDGYDGYTCKSADQPCSRVNSAIRKATAGDIILLSVRGYWTYLSEPVILVDRNLTISGGWDNLYREQIDYSYINGRNNGYGLKVNSGKTATVDRLIIQYSSGVQNDGTLTLNDTSIMLNGRGILNQGNLTLNQVSIHDNSINSPVATGGAGILNKGTLTVNNSTITNNYSLSHGAGITVDSGSTLYLNNTTIADNVAEQNGGGIYFYNVGTVYLQNSIISNNTAATGPNCLTIGGTTLTSLGYNILGDSQDCSFTTNTGDLLDIDAEISPMFTEILSQKGYNALNPGSPAIDAGNPAGCTDGSNLFTVDQRGLPRDSQCDMGAYEVVPAGRVDSISILSGSGKRATPGTTFSESLKVLALDRYGTPVENVSVTFTAPASGDSGVFTDSGTRISSSLSDGLGIAASSTFTANTIEGQYPILATVAGFPELTFLLGNFVRWYVKPTGSDQQSCMSPTEACLTIYSAMRRGADGETIYVAGGTYTETDTSNTSILIEKDLTLVGSWNDAFTTQSVPSILDGRNTRRVVNILSGASVVMDKFEFTRGYTATLYGGGINIDDGSLILRNSLVHHNSAKYGGGINAGGDSLVVENCTISSNQAWVGAGIHHSSDSAVYLNNTTVIGNIGFYLSGNAPSGGGISEGPMYAGSVFSIKNSIIASNYAANGPNCLGEIISEGYNIFGLLSGCSFTPGPGDLGDIVNPKLSVLQNNGGVLMSHIPLAGSPAIDAGNPVAPGSGGTACLATDARGVPRTVCDAGAIEGTGTGLVFTLVITFDTEHTKNLPGKIVCSALNANCTNGVNLEADASQKNVLSVMAFYLTRHGRNSVDNKGMNLFSTIRYDSGLDSSYWGSNQLVFGDAHGYVYADDIVGHEFTHGVTEFESNLLNYYQSGAIGESFSDLWGEFIDQTNGIGNDTSAVKWQIGEDITGLGTIRNMRNPLLYSQPDKMSAGLYYEGAADNGGVHTNGGVNNKAVFLMTDGGLFNRITVTGIGLNKVAAIYYEAQTNLLTSGSDYYDLYNTLYQGCTTLVGGTDGITLADCAQVRNATNAVQMNLQPATNFNPDATYCPTGLSTGSVLNLFQDDMEGTTDKWQADSVNGVGLWEFRDGFTTSGTHMIWGFDNVELTDSYIRTSVSIPLPSNASAYLFFKHAYDFDRYNTTYYDGGVLEYSTDGGTTWIDAKALYGSGQNYNGTLQNGFGNALGGRSAFVGTSHGYVSSRYNLTSLAGKNVYFRWRLGTDNAYNVLGWFIDDVSIYTCIAVPSMPVLVAPASNGLVTDYTPTLDWNDSTPNLHHYGLQVATDSAFTNLIVDTNTLTTSTYTFATDLTPNTVYYWHVKAFNITNQGSAYSATRIFRTALLPPTLLAPDNGVNLLGIRPEFDWEDVPGATGYYIQVATDNVFSRPSVRASTITSNYTPTRDLPRNVTLYWRVQAKGTNGPSGWSEVRTFGSPNSPMVPALVGPRNNTLQTSYTPTLSWRAPRAITGAPAIDHYDIQVSTDAAFAGGVIYTSTGLTYTFATPLDPNMKYYWRVRAVNTLGQYSGWSIVRYFRTAIIPPVLLLPANGGSAGTVRPVFDWGDVVGATGYYIEVSLSSVFSGTVIRVTVTGSTYTATRDLVPGTYYWRVRTNALNGPSAFSEVWTFTVP